MRSTPTIPARFREFKHRCYVNVFEEIPDERRFFGTENMPGFGDWDAPVLILAQDCGLVDSLRERIRSGHKEAHGYGEKVITNTKLRVVVERAEIESTLLYGSVLGSLWRKTGSKRRKPPEWEELLPEFVVPMLEWVVSSMDRKRLRAIGCLGQYAWEAVMAAAKKPELQHLSEWKRMRDGRASMPVTIAGQDVRVYPMYHPAYPRSYELLSMNWREMAAFVHQKTYKEINGS